MGRREVGTFLNFIFFSCTMYFAWSIHPAAFMFAVYNPCCYIFPVITFSSFKVAYKLNCAKAPPYDEKFYSLRSKLFHLSVLVLSFYFIAIVSCIFITGIDVHLVFQFTAAISVSTCVHELLEVLFTPF